MSGQERLIDEGMQEVREVLGDLAKEVIVEDREVIGLSREDFQSPTFQRAGYGGMTDVYGRADRSLYTVDFIDGSQVFVVSGRVSSGNPYEVGHAAGGGIDLRRQHTVIYQFDGQETITERLLTAGEANQYTGEHGRPQTLMPHLRQNMGVSVQVEYFIKPQPNS